jgi:hypothetical protein
MVIWATFGVPLFLAALAIPFIILRKIGISKASSMYAFLAAIFVCCWIIGFITQMAFLFSGVPGIKMLLLWILMFVVCSIFVSLNYPHIKKWADNNSKPKA